MVIRVFKVDFTLSIWLFALAEVSFLYVLVRRCSVSTCLM
jgi:hypothetical protein